MTRVSTNLRRWAAPRLPSDLLLNPLEVDIVMLHPYQSLQACADVGRAKLAPSAVSLHPGGPALHDDTWLVSLNADRAVRLHNISTGHFLDLAPSDVVAVKPDLHAPREGLRHLRVTLRRQIWLRGVDAGWC